jgi:hypothetical protein
MEGSAFGDPARYAQAVEAAYRDMWQRWCAEQDHQPQSSARP